MKIKNVLLSLVRLFMAISIVSCKKDSNVDENLHIQWDVSQVPVLSTNFTVGGAYFNEDSISKFNLGPVPGGKVINGSILNNFGVGVDTITGSYKSGIFKLQTSLAPVIIYNLNEFFVKKVIVSWDAQKNNQIIDSITTKILEGYPAVHSFSNLASEDKSDLKCIYIDFILINKLGSVKIDYNNQNMNDFLYYKSSKYGGVGSDKITLTPQQFKDIYGNKYASSLILGTSLHCRMRIASIDISSGKEKEILAEALDMIKKEMNENAKWNDLINNSSYFKHSLLLVDIGSGIPNLDFPIPIDEMDKNFTNNDSTYKAAHFGILCTGYEPYSQLYPQFEFIK